MAYEAATRRPNCRVAASDLTGTMLREWAGLPSRGRSSWEPGITRLRPDRGVRSMEKTMRTRFKQSKLSVVVFASLTALWITNFLPPAYAADEKWRSEMIADALLA